MLYALKICAYVGVGLALLVVAWAGSAPRALAQTPLGCITAEMAEASVTAGGGNWLGASGVPAFTESGGAFLYYEVEGLTYVIAVLPNGCIWPTPALLAGKYEPRGTPA